MIKYKSTVRLICGDGVVRLKREYFEKSIFNNPDIAKADSYTLKCKALSQFVNDLLDLVDGESERVTITEDNYDELRSLCEELGFKGLVTEFRAFRGGRGRESDLKEFLQLKELVMRQQKCLIEVQGQLKEVLSWKRKAEFATQESVSRQFQSLERKVEDLKRVCEERNVKASRETEQALRQCAKQSDLEKLARNVAQLKENENGRAAKSPVNAEPEVQVRPSRSLEVVEPSRSGLPPLKQPVTKPAPPTLGRRSEYVYRESSKLDGIIASLTRRFCGRRDSDVHSEGIVNVTASSQQDGRLWGPASGAVKLESDGAFFWSKCEPNEWICYDFKERRVIPTSYSARCFGQFRPNHWVIEVSNDGKSWTEIDRRDTNELNGAELTRNFRISRVPSEGFRFFRLRQTGPNDEGELCLVLRALEIFGTLFEK